MLLGPAIRGRMILVDYMGSSKLLVLYLIAVSKGGGHVVRCSPSFPDGESALQAGFAQRSVCFGYRCSLG